MGYIKLFNNMAAYQNYINGKPLLPNVSLVEEDDVVFYNPEKEASFENEYLHFEALEDGMTVSFKKALNDGNLIANSNILYYSTDKTTWKTLSPENESTEPINAGEKIYFKGNCVLSESEQGIGVFVVSKKYNTAGNIMSILFADNYIGKTDLTGYDYIFMGLFMDIYAAMSGTESNLISAENLILPATTLASYCYYGMFGYCTNLTAAPALPATTLANDCYGMMFTTCISLTTAPELPATTLTNGCYGNMFEGCSNLTAAPELPATILASYCYRSMFKGCTNLNYIKMLAIDISAYNCLKFWVEGVASTGTFVKNVYANWNTTGVNGVPDNWQITYDDDDDNYIVDNELPPLYFEALEDDFTLSFNINNIGVLRYSVDGKTWNTLESNANTTPINTGEKIYLKGSLIPSSSESGIGTFTINKQCNVAGNVMSLLFVDDFIGKTDLTGYNCVFNSLFNNCTTIQSAENLILPATTLTYKCYQYMFYGCTSLTTAPALPATTLANYCYSQMFYACTKLNYIKMLATNISGSYCLNYWVEGVSSTGTFVKADGVEIPTGTAGIPRGWSITNIVDINTMDFDSYFTLNTNREEGEIKFAMRNGMTWEEYCNSELNGIDINGVKYYDLYCHEVSNYVIYRGSGGVQLNDVSAKGTDLIDSSVIYDIFWLPA